MEFAKISAFTLIICSLFLFQDLFCVILKDVVVPPRVLIDGRESETIILDCNYDIKENTNFLVVKWYKDNEAVYQWIRGQKPSVFPSFRGKVDISFKESSDPDRQYRALALINPSIDTTGIYKCVVQTAKSTAAREKRLQIFNIENYTLSLYHHELQNETHLECIVDNVYPEPTMHLTTSIGDEVKIISLIINENEKGLFNATTIGVLNNEVGGNNEFMCTVSFIGYNINLSTTATSGCDILALADLFLLIWIINIFLRIN